MDGILAGLDPARKLAFDPASIEALVHACRREREGRAL